MAATSAAVLLPPASAALMAMAALQLISWAAAAAAVPPPIGLPAGCNTTCGNVSVPYPFGYGHSRCYWPGLNLTCNTSHDPPRLLLGDGTLRVTEISLANNTVRVVPTGSIIHGNFTTPSWDVPFGSAFTEHGYLLSSSNVLIVSGCNVAATLLADSEEKTSTQIVMGGCATFCTIMDGGGHPYGVERSDLQNQSCAVNMGCCRAPFVSPSLPRQVQAKWIYSGSHKLEPQIAPVKVFVAEEGWLNENRVGELEVLDEAPFLLEWMVKLETQLHDSESDCPEDVRRRVCKSEHSECHSDDMGMGGYNCRCQDGYEGNPYLYSGCQDINECKLPSEESGCFGTCINTNGSRDCLCPQGTFGNPNVKDGCVKLNSTIVEDDVLLHIAAQRGLRPNCSTPCGSIEVPYPFGISPGCHLPGFNLTCDTSHDPPRLLLRNSDGNRLAVDTFFPDSLRVIYTSTTNTDVIGDGMDDTVVTFQLPGDIREPYVLSSRNEFILYGCDLNATLLDGDYTSNRSNSSIICGCVSTCNSGLVVEDGGGARPPPLSRTQTHGGGRHCSGRDGCCHAPINDVGRTPNNVTFTKLVNRITSKDGISRAFAFISEEGLTDQWYMILNRTNLQFPPFNVSSPILLRWAVKHGLPNQLCKSEHSYYRQENGGGFTCHCSTGYIGNPYVAHGCQEECNVRSIAAGYPTCFGHCNLSAGHVKCLCPRGTHGNPYVPDGCIRFPPGLTIGLSVASGPVILLLVLTMIIVLRKIKQRRIKVSKQKYFKQNRGQLLQQLVSQKADIAERMIISVDEIAKATNNFDKARELGGGGHGTVYKGILSDQQVVAIKKSKITVQKEIDEFINEVAILSQINHKNVVKLLGCCLETEVPLLVYEFISNGTLYHHLHVEGPRSLSWGNRLRIATEIAASIAYLHSSVSVPIIHRDIKSSNILLDDTMTSKISDFGASRYVPVDQTGLTTMVQGTIGYLDPMYFYTGRLTEKSDVYSFGVILVELLTRKKPFSYLFTEGEGLVSHFVNLLSEGNLIQIIDPQVIEEGGREVQEVAALAASCINLRGEERPTMRQVEHTLHGLQGSERYNKNSVAAEELENVSTLRSYPQSSEVGKRFEESSRRYSLEQEMMMSAKYPR